MWHITRSFICMLGKRTSRPARIRWLVFIGSGLFAGIAGGLAALNDELITSGNMSPEASASVFRTNRATHHRVDPSRVTRSHHSTLRCR